MYIALSLNPTNDTLASLRRIEGLATLAVLASWWAALWLIGAACALAQKAETADAIASGDLARRVAAGTPTSEVGRLGTALNEMLARSRRPSPRSRLRKSACASSSADASHELRTPLTSIRGYAELLRRAGLRRGGYQ